MRGTMAMYSNSARGKLMGPLQGCRGYMDKKSGGKEGKNKAKVLEKWTKRYFVLPEADATLSYYKDEHSFNNGRPPLGAVDCEGARSASRPR